MKGDEKRTPGERLDEAMQDQDLYKIEIKLVYIKPKAKSPKPVKPAKENR